MRFYKEPRHHNFNVRAWTSFPVGKVLERVRITSVMQSSRFEWYLNGVRIDGFTASQLLKDSH